MESFQKKYDDLSMKSKLIKMAKIYKCPIRLQYDLKCDGWIVIKRFMRGDKYLSDWYDDPEDAVNEAFNKDWNLNNETT